MILVIVDVFDDLEKNHRYIIELSDGYYSIIGLIYDLNVISLIK